MGVCIKIMSTPIGRRGSSSEHTSEPLKSKNKTQTNLSPHFDKNVRSRMGHFLSRKELEGFKNTFKITLEGLKGNQKHLSIEKQTEILNDLIRSGAISLKLNGHEVKDLYKSAFKNFSEETREAVLHATFFYDAYDQTLNLETMSLDDLHFTLKRPVQVDWKISEVDNSFRRIAVAIKASSSSPSNPSSIEIKGTG